MLQHCPDAPSLFKGRHFDHSIIILCIRWYITYKLSYRDLVEMMAEIAISGIELAQKIRKGQFDTSAVTMRDRASVRHVWEAVLAA